MEIVLEAFEGPLHLLLHLIEKNEINIYDIPIAELTDQYMAVIRSGPSDMEGMSEFLLMAATLLEIKSRMLLPKPPAPEEGEAEDPREALVRKLLEYKRCQTLAEHLKTYGAPGARIVREPERPLVDTLARLEPATMMNGVALDQLWRLFSDVVKRRELRIDHVRAHYGDMPRERYTMEEKIALIERELTHNGGFLLSRFFEDCASREEMIVTFLAVLEMIRLGRMRVRQSQTFADIECMKGNL